MRPEPRHELRSRPRHEPLDRRAFLRRAGLLAAGALGARHLPAVLTARAAGSVAAPAIVGRSGWGADERLRRPGTHYHPIRKFVVHHTVTPNGDPHPAARVRSIYRSHLHRRDEDGEPWIDIGYNFLVDESGRIYEGRWARRYAGGEVHDAEDPFGRGVRGAHVEDANAGSVGVALLGTYGTRRPTDAALDALVHLMAWKCARHGLDPRGTEPYARADGRTVAIPTIVGHRDLGSTSCPGQGAYDLLPRIRDRVAERVPSPAPEGPGGYRILHADGSVSTTGAAPDLGDLPSRGVRTRASSLAGTGGGGFWIVDVVGGVFAFDAPYHGSIPGRRADGVPIGEADAVDVSAAGGGGYWLLDRSGGIFSFGDARYRGSIPQLRREGVRIPRTGAVALAPTPTGRGYWVLDRAGGVFTFGDARYRGSIPQLRREGVRIPRSDAVDLTATPTGGGYWVLDRRGGVFAFGDAGYHGSIPGTGWHGAAARRLVPTARGYAVLLADGAVIPFGDAPLFRYAKHVPAVGLQVVG